jgi:DNA uptake protein ComE-like DNA-binding protein
MRLQRSLLLLALAAALHFFCTQASAQVSFEQQLAHRAQPSAALVDINAATPHQLNALPGFGPAYTRRIIAGRPYTAKNQLVTRGVIPQGAYERVSALIIAHRVGTARSPGNPHPSK